MKPLSERQAEAVVSLQNNATDFNLMLEAIDSYRLDSLEALLNCPPGEAERFRGEVRALTEVLRALSGARETIMSYRSPRSRSAA